MKQSRKLRLVISLKKINKIMNLTIKIHLKVDCNPEIKAPRNVSELQKKMQAKKAK